MTCILTVVCHSGSGMVWLCFSASAMPFGLLWPRRASQSAIILMTSLDPPVVSKSRASFDPLRALLLELCFDISEKL